MPNFEQIELMQKFKQDIIQNGNHKINQHLNAIYNLIAHFEEKYVQTQNVLFTKAQKEQLKRWCLQSMQIQIGPWTGSYQSIYDNTLTVLQQLNQTTHNEVVNTCALATELKAITSPIPIEATLKFIFEHIAQHINNINNSEFRLQMMLRSCNLNKNRFQPLLNSLEKDRNHNQNLISAQANHKVINQKIFGDNYQSEKVFSDDIRGNLYHALEVNTFIGNCEYYPQNKVQPTHFKKIRVNDLIHYLNQELNH